VGKIVQPLQSINCHDSHAHGYERHGLFTQLVGNLLGMVWVGSSRSALWYAAGAKPVCMFWLQVGCLEHWSFVATCVTPVSFRPLITMGNLGAWLCLDIV
jgi:hypothetical protein